MERMVWSQNSCINNEIVLELYHTQRLDKYSSIEVVSLVLYKKSFNCKDIIVSMTIFQYIFESMRFTLTGRRIEIDKLLSKIQTEIIWENIGWKYWLGSVETMWAHGLKKEDRLAREVDGVRLVLILSYPTHEWV